MSTDVGQMEQEIVELRAKVSELEGTPLADRLLNALGAYAETTTTLRHALLLARSSLIDASCIIDPDHVEYANILIALAEVKRALNGIAPGRLEQDS